MHEDVSKPSAAWNGKDATFLKHDAFITTRQHPPSFAISENAREMTRTTALVSRCNTRSVQYQCWRRWRILLSKGFSVSSGIHLRTLCSFMDVKRVIGGLSHYFWDRDSMKELERFLSVLAKRKITWLTLFWQDRPDFMFSLSPCLMSLCQETRLHLWDLIFF